MRRLAKVRGICLYELLLLLLLLCTRDLVVHAPVGRRTQEMVSILFDEIGEDIGQMVQ